MSLPPYFSLAKHGSIIVKHKRMLITKRTQDDAHGEQDDEGPPPAEVRAASVGHGPQDGCQEEADQRGEAPDEGHVLVLNS